MEQREYCLRDVWDVLIGDGQSNIRVVLGVRVIFVIDVESYSDPLAGLLVVVSC